MNLGDTNLDKECELAIGLLCKYMPIGEERKKPLLMHCLRVGMRLYDNNYPRDIILGGFLHDLLEWTDGSEAMIDEMFGERARDIVKANTKNRDISDPAARRREYVSRCIQLGEDATIVKAADILDSYHFYQSVSNTNEIARCVDTASVILEQLPDTFNDPIFTELRLVK